VVRGLLSTRGVKRSCVVVIFLAGCPDPPASAPTPSDACVGFGLEFTTIAFGDAFYFANSTTWRGAYGDKPEPIARGGVEWTEVYGMPWTGTAFAPFDADVNGPALALEQMGPYTESVPVTGAEEGVADLCVYDAGSTTLHDGTRFAVRDVASMFVVPAVASYQSFETFPDPYPLADWRMFTGTKRRLGVALTSAENWRLVDDEMTVTATVGDSPAMTPTRETWDTVSLDVPQATTVRLRATLASGETHDASIGFVDHVDRVVRHPSFDDLASLIVGGSWGYECFDAMLGDTRVLAAPFQFSAGPEIALSPEWANCVYLQPVAAGAGALTVTVGDAALELPYVVR
jgi:hypothetical protein